MPLPSMLTHGTCALSAASWASSEGASGDSIYITFVEWASESAIQRAREAAAAKHEQMNLDPQELFRRLQIKADLGNYVHAA